MKNYLPSNCSSSLSKKTKNSFIASRYLRLALFNIASSDFLLRLSFDLAIDSSSSLIILSESSCERIFFFKFIS